MLEDKSFRHVICESLTITNFAGRTKVKISSEGNTGYIIVYNQLGNRIVHIGIDDNGDGEAVTYRPRTITGYSEEVKGQI